ncbi:MAG TPA: VWA domain-containing protein [Pyrinomonadaceae bacterium]|nr:VWA domain-containing protein [Pyrinomonadaceae bacterium]
MKLRYSAILLVCFAAFASMAFAQSGRTDTKTDGKKNQRSTEPTPSPTPLATPKTLVPASDLTADDGEIIKVNTLLVSIPVRVMDRKGRFIGGLGKEDFKVFENGKEQEIALFSNENEPFTVALVLDMSYSTKFKLAEIQSAAIAFIDQLRPNDRVMVVSFDGEVHVLCEATNERKEIYRAIKSTAIATGTSLYEAVDLVMNNRLRQIDGRKAIILFTDGVDTTSRRSNDLNNLHDAMELDSLIYTIRYDTFADVQNMKNGPIVQQPKISIPTQGGNPLPNMLPTIMTPSSQGTTAAEYEKAAEYLDQLAIRTGGRRYDATSLGNLADAYSKIASELREFYSVAYYPSEDRMPGKSSSVKVKVDKDGVVVRARETYTSRKKPQIH